MDITRLAAVHARWVEARSQLTAENIANADTPGYERAAGSSFGDMVSEAARPFAMRATHAAHLAPEPVTPGFAVDHEGAVRLQSEMVDLAAHRRAHDLNVAVSAAFHRFQLSVAR